MPATENMHHKMRVISRTRHPSRENMIKNLALGLLVGAASSYVAAQTTSDIKIPPNNAYSQDSRGIVTRSAYGLCWRSGNWIPDDAIPGCDGALLPPIPNPTAPELVSHTENTVPADTVLATSTCNFTLALESDQIFAFNSALLNKSAKQRIEREVLPRLAKCNSLESITITGHTDILGSRGFNQALSEKRAASVAGYLRAHGVTTAIKTIGAGEKLAIKACDEKLKHAELLACLAPNRRVLIDVHGAQR